AGARGERGRRGTLFSNSSGALPAAAGGTAGKARGGWRHRPRSLARPHRRGPRRLLGPRAHENPGLGGLPASARIDSPAALPYRFRQSLSFKKTTEGGERWLARLTW